MSIETATIDDLGGIIEVNEELRLFTPGGKKENEWQDPQILIRQIEEGKLYVSKDGILVQAAVCLDLDRDPGEIETLAVRHVSKRMGLGRMLVNFAVEEARKKGILNLEVGSIFQYKAKGFYEACGFEVVGITHELKTGNCCYEFSMQL